MEDAGGGCRGQKRPRLRESGQAQRLLIVKLEIQSAIDRLNAVLAEARRILGPSERLSADRPVVESSSRRVVERLAAAPDQQTARGVCPATPGAAGGGADLPLSEGRGGASALPGRGGDGASA